MDRVRWIPGEGGDEAALLSALGLTQVEELFKDIPAKARLRQLGLPAGLSEEQVVGRVGGLLAKNRPLAEFDSFLGGGLYQRFSPAVVDGLLQRSEFYTSYTPYQAEASQGMLQALFEFQSLWLELTDMEVANASVYDGTTGLAEAALLARRLHPGQRLLLPASLDWESRSVLENYTGAHGIKLVTIPIDPVTGALDLGFIEREARVDCFGAITELPDGHGIPQEVLPRVKSSIGDVPLVVRADPLALSVLEPPGRWGADIVIGEGQGLGVPLSYGGPLLGLMAGRRRDMRLLPGRIVGATQDREGRRAFTLTLQTREQHIRRSRATSNICTNQSLMALAFLIHVSAVGPRGLRSTAQQLAERSHELAAALAAVPGLKVPRYTGPFLHEFVMEVTGLPVNEFLAGLVKSGVLGGRALNDPRTGGSPQSSLLVSVGTRTDAEAIARYAEAARKVLASGGSA